MKPVDPAERSTLLEQRGAGAGGRDEPDTLRSAEHEAVPAREGSIIVDDPTTVMGVYAFGEVLGRGGMGEVLLAHDRRIGRDIAVKRLHSASPSEKEIMRFLREARIQARLEHPAIVPVHELARDTLGNPYFTMKRLTGTTLAEILSHGSASRQRLLRAFVDVCRAVDFAHSRGVVHRDLKPANIMLGEFGEVYVLDWGAARVLLDASIGGVTADIDTLEGVVDEYVLGTAGYMAPEQLQQSEVGREADVYALGAILFELLTGELLHPHTAAAYSTLGSFTVTAPAKRRPDRGIAPELDALCTAMLVRDPEQRPTARRCAESVEEFLDGDRDLARRRALAGELVSRAQVALDTDRRADAMRAASRALALDPVSDRAAEIVTHLMLEPPREPPPELRWTIRHSDAGEIGRHARAASRSYVVMAAFLTTFIAGGVRHWPIVTASIAVLLAMAWVTRQLVREPDRPYRWMMSYALGIAALIAVLSRLGSSFTFVAALIAFITSSLVTYPAFLGRPWVVIATTLGGFLIPIGLEVIGVLEPTWVLVDGGLLVRGYAGLLDGALAVVMLLLGTVTAVVAAGIQSVRLAREHRDAQHRLVIQAWHLRQLLPANRVPPV